MHLLDTFMFTLHEFQGSAIPDYAILSHRWDSEEVSFRDLQSGKGGDMAGFKKIKGCCAQAASEGWQYVVGSYGTRNIVVIESWFWSDRQSLVLILICLSSILRGIPLSGGVSPSPVFTAVV
jgi:hypothetical protein